MMVSVMNRVMRDAAQPYSGFNIDLTREIGIDEMGTTLASIRLHRRPTAVVPAAVNGAVPHLGSGSAGADADLYSPSSAAVGAAVPSAGIRPKLDFNVASHHLPDHSCAASQNIAVWDSNQRVNSDSVIEFRLSEFAANDIGLSGHFVFQQ